MTHRLFAMAMHVCQFSGAVGFSGQEDNSTGPHRFHCWVNYEGKDSSVSMEVSGHISLGKYHRRQAIAHSSSRE